MSYVAYSSIAWYLHNTLSRHNTLHNYLLNNTYDCYHPFSVSIFAYIHSPIILRRNHVLKYQSWSQSHSRNGKLTGQVRPWDSWQKGAFISGLSASGGALCRHAMVPIPQGPGGTWRVWHAWHKVIEESLEIFCKHFEPLFSLFLFLQLWFLTGRYINRCYYNEKKENEVN